MVKPTILAASLGVVAVTNALNSYTVKTHTPAPFHPVSPDTVVENVVHLERRTNRHRPSRSHELLRGDIIRERHKKIEIIKRQEDPDYDVIALGASDTDPLYSKESGIEFLTNIRLNGHRFQVIVDTGSSDTWLAPHDFQCVDVYGGTPVDQATCNFGPLWNVSTEYKQRDGEYFNITYGDGEYLTGVVGIEPVIFANIPIKNQTIAKITTAGWRGDGNSSGLVGLAYPALTSAYTDTNAGQDLSKPSHAYYNPIFFNMFEQNLTKPVFSLAIDRDDGQGVMAFGGVPNITYDPLVSTPIQYLQYQGQTSKAHQFYSIQFAVNFPGVQDVSSYEAVHEPFARPDDSTYIQGIVDSGTTLLYLPDGLARAANALFDPAAYYDYYSGAYIVECDAKTPNISIVINGTSLPIDGRDLIVGDGDSGCISGISSAGSSLSILGDVFLKNVLAVFDVGAAQMRFGLRHY